MVLLSLLVADALACATCQDPDPVRSGVYMNMTAFMSLSPLVAFGSGAFWIWRRMQTLDR